MPGIRHAQLSVGTTAQLPSATALAGRHATPANVLPSDMSHTSWYRTLYCFTIALLVFSMISTPFMQHARPNHSKPSVSMPLEGL